MCDIITKSVTVFNTDLRHISKICQITNDQLKYTTIIHFTMSPRVEKEHEPGGTRSVASVRTSPRPYNFHPCHHLCPPQTVSVPSMSTASGIRAIVVKAVGRNLPQNTLNGQRTSLNTQNVLGRAGFRNSVSSVCREMHRRKRSFWRRTQSSQSLCDSLWQRTRLFCCRIYSYGD